jgi:hypothetical protein
MDCLAVSIWVHFFRSSIRTTQFATLTKKTTSCEVVSGCDIDFKSSLPN